MTDDNISALIDRNQFSAALKTIDSSAHAAAAVTTAQACKLIRYMVGRGMIKRSISLAEIYLERHPDDPDMQFLLGNTALKLGDVAKALVHLERADVLTPDKPLVLVNLAVGYNAIDRHGDAVRVLQRAIRINPQYGFAHQKLGSILCKAGQVQGGVRAFERAMMLTNKPHYLFARIMFWKNYLSATDPVMLHADAAVWGQGYTHTFEKGVGVYLNDLGHGRRLNVGFVSPDFCAHPVSFFVEPLLRHLDRDNFKIFAYSDVARPDAITKSIGEQVDVFHATHGKDMQTVARMVLDDQIDILFDLAGHTGAGRLDMFHLRPAPVQISWLGYPATTGSAAIKYRLSDRYADPAAISDPVHTETLLRVDGGFLCYAPSDRTPDPVTESPFETNGYITFGSFNNLAKLSPECIGMWADILEQVPNSVLMIKRRELKDPWVRSYFIDQFARRGINRKRLQFKTSQSKLEGHLRNYARIDIALDSFPYNGTTTTFEALWMNVPVLTLAGSTHASRVGQSILHHAGLGELTASSPAEYIDKAARLAGDPDRLANYRQSLRSSLAASSLTDQPRFARNVSRLLRKCWIDWSREQQEQKKIILEDET